MPKKMPINQFVGELKNAYNRADGYIMGATGQNPKKWSTTSWWYTQYTDKSQLKKALYWREHATRVWDCNGMAEGIYKDYSGIDINTKARYNYTQWCDPKGAGMIPVKYRQPGAAVFWGDTGKPGTIHHVGYLIEPVKKNKPEGDWYIIEARGVSYGVVQTRLNKRKPNFWGLMTKYFDYSDPIKVTPPDVPEDDKTFGSRTLQKGMTGEDVKTLQTLLLQNGCSLPKYGADGDFGSETESAVKAYQKKNNLTINGIVDAAMFTKLKTTIQTILITGLLVNVRANYNTSSKILGVVSKGTILESLNIVAANGWYKVKYKEQEGWVSNKYSEAK